MQKTLIKLHTILTMGPELPLLEGGGIVVNGNSIERLLTKAELKEMISFDGEIVDASRLVAIPGFVQTHLHLCQTLFRGLADDLELLDWLRLKIFPFEAAHNDRSMHASAMVGIAELIRSGTTTIMDMGSVHHEEEVIRAIVETGLRAFVGKSMIDQNDVYTGLRESTRDAISSTFKYAEQWHNAAGGRIRYAVAPRFLLSCTDALLQEAYEMTRSFPGMLYHTHAAESRQEMDAVRKRCHMDNVEYFEKLQILQTNTCLAHCIWLNQREIQLMADRDAKVAHCPSSNLKLGSGVAQVPELLSRGIAVSLGADGAPCNNTLNMFEEMRLAALIQKPLHGPSAMNARTVFEMATIGGARALGMEREIGSITPGKRADMAFLDLTNVWNPYIDQREDGMYSSIVYSCSPENVRSVMVDGRWLYRNGVHTSLDVSAVLSTAREELKHLLGRVH